MVEDLNTAFDDDFQIQSYVTDGLLLHILWASPYASGFENVCFLG
jgi:hypothetical protein